MGEFRAACRAALPGAVVSVVVSGIVLYYIRSYIDHKLKEEEEIQDQLKKVRVQRTELEMQRRQALGRVLYWMHRGLTKPPPNGELQEAMEAFSDVEKRQKELERKLLAGLMIEEDME